MTESNPAPINNPPVRKKSTLAIWSLVLGIFSLTCVFSIFTAIPGIICGHLALGRIKRSGGYLFGRGWAIAGLITSYFGLGLVILTLFAIPYSAREHMMWMRGNCAYNLREIQNAKEQWALENKRKPTYVPTEHELQPFLHRSMPSCPGGGVYSINAVEQDPTCSFPGHKLTK